MYFYNRTPIKSTFIFWNLFYVEMDILNWYIAIYHCLILSFLGKTVLEIWIPLQYGKKKTFKWYIKFYINGCIFILLNLANGHTTIREKKYMGNFEFSIYTLFKKMKLTNTFSPKDLESVCSRTYV